MEYFEYLRTGLVFPSIGGGGGFSYYWYRAAGGRKDKCVTFRFQVCLLVCITAPSGGAAVIVKSMVRKLGPGDRSKLPQVVVISTGPVNVPPAPGAGLIDVSPKRLRCLPL